MLTTSVRSIAACIGRDADSLSVLRDVMSYVELPLGEETVSLRQHFQFFQRPQLRINLVRYASALWPSGLTPKDGTVAENGFAGLAAMVLQARKVFAAAPLGGWTIGRVDYFDTGLAPNDPTGMPGLSEELAKVTQFVKIADSVRAKRSFDVVLFRTWAVLSNGQSVEGRAPAHSCTSGQNFFPVIDGWHAKSAVNWVLIALTFPFSLGPFDQAFGIAKQRCPAVRADMDVVHAGNVLAHEICHYVGWIFHDSSPQSLMSAGASGTAISMDQAQDMLDTLCWKSPGCSVLAQVIDELS